MQFQLLRILLLLTICSLPSLVNAGSGAQGISDFAVAFDDTTGESTIYVTDEVSHAIYKIDGAHADLHAPKETLLGELKPFFSSPELSAPTGIAYFNGKLLVCDKSADAVFEIDTTTKILSLLFEKGVIAKPVRVAVSQNGRVAVTNDAGDIVLYQRLTQSFSSKRRIENTDIAFAGDDLVVVNSAGKISLIQGKTYDGPSPTSTPLELSAAAKDNQQLVDVAFVNGIYYLVGGGQAYAHIRTKNATLPLFNQPLPLRSLSGIRVNKQLVAVLDSRNQSILQFDRPVAMTAGFDEGSAAALIPFYEYLLNQNALPTRTYVAARDYKSAGDLLREQKIVFQSTTDNDAVSLFCRLNKDLCPSDAEEKKAIAIKKGRTLTLPALSYTELVGYDTQNLKNESVSDYLTKTFFFSPKLKDRFTEDVLWSLNELSKSDTLEFQLQKKVPGALLAMPPRKNLQPGSIINLGAAQDAIEGTVPRCGIEVKSSARALNLAQLVSGTVKGPDVFSQLPRASIAAAFTKRLQQLGITEVQYEFEDLTVEQADQKAVSSTMSNSGETASSDTAPAELAASPSPTVQPSPSPQTKTCLTNLFGPSNYFIVDAVKVNVGRYKILKDGALIRFNKSEELQRLGLLGELDKTRNYSFVVKTPFYVAYRVSPWTGETIFQGPTKPITSVSSIKQRGNQAILRLTNTSLLLPYVKQWQFTFLLSEKELTDDGSEFNKLKSSRKFTALRAEETSRAATALHGVFNSVFDDPPPLATVTMLRAGLKTEIHFITDDKPIDVRIGIGEKPCTVDKNHPDFKNQDGTNAWMKDPAAPAIACPTPSEDVKTVKMQVDESEHGTHVAGLIGARAKTTAPGLVPTAQLFLVDATDATTIFSSVDNAVARGVFIFNFSFGNLDNDENLQTAIQSKWAKRLFVIAVDNDGTDLAKTKKPPVSWLDTIKNNMIGVGSSIGAKGSQYMLGDWEGPDGSLEPGSSYGKTYVQLIAPGHSIYSTIPGNAYGPATGTSFAAPQVTATAALLFGGADITDPAQIKARLIYTSDWFEQLRGKVWGGFLNVTRAVWEPKRNLLTTESASTVIDAIKLDPNNMTDLTIKGGTSYEPAAPDKLMSEIKVPFENVLRITRRHNLAYRVIYIDNNMQVHIVLNAAISGTVPCETVEQWNGSVFTNSACSKYGARLDASQLLDYVARIPSDISF